MHLLNNLVNAYYYLSLEGRHALNNDDGACRWFDNDAGCVRVAAWDACDYGRVAWRRNRCGGGCGHRRQRRIGALIGGGLGAAGGALTAPRRY